jgi:hypothetical protein
VIVEVAVADIACPLPCNVSPLITWNEKKNPKLLDLGPLKLRKPKHDQCAINKDAASLFITTSKSIGELLYS